MYDVFQSTLPARGATLFIGYEPLLIFISIHAPRTGSDRIQHFVPAIAEISIHAPRTGSDCLLIAAQVVIGGFQSTLPARGATPACTAERWNGQFQSTLPARGATPTPTGWISTAKFQSTLPARGATCGGRVWVLPDEEISIHAPRTGSDDIITAGRDDACDFNPRSPHGERHVLHADGRSHLRDFNPRSPHGERRRRRGRNADGQPISIHAPRTGSDVSVQEVTRA